jgi:hypothetical protein
LSTHAGRDLLNELLARIKRENYYVT